MEHNISLKYKTLVLRQIQQSDIEHLRKWRNDKEKSKFLRKIKYITPEIVETGNIGDLIGSLSIYNFKDHQVEIGRILIGDERAKGFGYGRLAFAMLMTYAFNNLNVEKIVATVNKNNIPARISYFRLGFKVVGETFSANAGCEDIIEIDKNTFIKNNKYCSEILIES